MKKKIVICLLSFTLIISGCVYQRENFIKKNTAKDESKNTINNENFFLIQETDETLISIMIPQIYAIHEDNMPLIKKFVVSKMEDICGGNLCLTESETDVKGDIKNYSDYYIKVNSKISYNSNDLISIVFEGIVNKKATAHPYHLFFTFNFNPKTQKQVAFSDMYILDEKLYNIFSQQAEKNILEQTDGVWPEGWDSFSQELCSKEKFLNGLIAVDEIYWYHIKNGIGISYPVPYALGDHKEVEIPDELLEKRSTGYGSLR